MAKGASGTGRIQIQRRRQEQEIDKDRMTMSYRGTQVPAYRSAAGRERNRDRNRKHNPTRHDRRTMHHMQGPA